MIDRPFPGTDVYSPTIYMHHTSETSQAIPRHCKIFTVHYSFEQLLTWTVSVEQKTSGVGGRLCNIESGALVSGNLVVQLLQHTLCTAVGECHHVVVVWSYVHKPLSPNRQDYADVVVSTKSW